MEENGKNGQSWSIGRTCHDRSLQKKSATSLKFKFLNKHKNK